MPTSFLYLPRELRDQIYEYVLISPTGLIEPILIRNPQKAKRARQQHHQPQSQSQSQSQSQGGSRTKTLTSRNDPKTRFALHTNPLSHTYTLNPDPKIQNRTSLSLSLRRVCRQITHETQSLFWDHNTFYFRSFSSSAPDGHHPPHSGVVKTLKQMGQTASRLIQSITIRMSDLDTSYNTLGKMLLKFESRARCGQFKKLTLIWEPLEWRRLIAGYVSFEGYDVAEHQGKAFAELLDGLAVGKEGGRFERVIEIREPWFETGDQLRNLKGLASKTARELHLAFGGKVYVDKRFVWDRGEQIGSYTEEEEVKLS